jgi:hypothetical protein
MPKPVRAPFFKSEVLPSGLRKTEVNQLDGELPALTTTVDSRVAKPAFNSVIDEVIGAPSSTHDGTAGVIDTTGASHVPNKDVQVLPQSNMRQETETVLRALKNLPNNERNKIIDEVNAVPMKSEHELLRAYDSLKKNVEEYLTDNPMLATTTLLNAAAIPLSGADAFTSIVSTAMAVTVGLVGDKIINRARRWANRRASE